MLRSIVAVWCLALALLIIAANAGCALGGCANGDDCSAGITPWQPDMARPPICPGSCDGCAADQICFQGGVAAGVPSFCARACSDDRDCAHGSRCASLFAAMQPSVCIGSGSPMGCGYGKPGFSCDLQGPSCKDADTLMQPFVDSVYQVCGWELVHCANGCVTGACR